MAKKLEHHYEEVFSHIIKGLFKSKSKLLEEQFIKDHGDLLGKTYAKEFWNKLEAARFQIIDYEPADLSYKPCRKDPDNEIPDNMPLLNHF